MHDATRAIGKCIAAANEERAIDLVKCVTREGTALDLAELERLEAGCSVKLRYYLRRATKAIRDRIGGGVTPPPARVTPAAPAGPGIRRTIAAAEGPTLPPRRDAAAAPPRPAPPALAPDLHALAEELSARVDDRPARRIDAAPRAPAALPDAELVRLALDLDGLVDRHPAARVGERRRSEALDRVDADRLAGYFERIVLDRPAVRFGGADPGDLETPAMTALLAELAAERRALDRLDLEASFLDPAFFSAASPLAA